MEKLQAMKEIKTELTKAVKYKENVEVAVNIYDCYENDEQTYDIEITYYLNGVYEDCYVSERGYEGELPEVKKRAKAVLKTVKGWFENTDTPVRERVTLYTNAFEELI